MDKMNNNQQNNDKLMKENEKLKEEMAKKDQQIGIMKEEITKLQEENQRLKDLMTKIKNSCEKSKSSIYRRSLPAELMNELFGSLSFENAYCLLAKMPNGLLARNVQKITNALKIIMKGNKWNKDDCGSKLAISEDGLSLKHNIGPSGFNRVRAIWPIPGLNFLSTNMPLIMSYYEVQILAKQIIYGIAFGFYSREVPHDGDWRHRKGNNSLGINCKRVIWIDGSTFKFGNGYGEYFGDASCGYFINGDVIGIGIIYYPANLSMHCFTTCNGELFGKGELPSKFANIELFPAFTLYNVGESIRANFGKEKWHFKQFNKLLQ